MNEAHVTLIVFHDELQRPRKHCSRSRYAIHCGDADQIVCVGRRYQCPLLTTSVRTHYVRYWDPGRVEHVAHTHFPEL